VEIDVNITYIRENSYKLILHLIHDFFMLMLLFGKW
jgi:hypothetical protein